MIVPFSLAGPIKKCSLMQLIELSIIMKHAILSAMGIQCKGINYGLPVTIQPTAFRLEHVDSIALIARSSRKTKAIWHVLMLPKDSRRESAQHLSQDPCAKMNSSTGQISHPKGSKYDKRVIYSSNSTTQILRKRIGFP